MQVPPPPPKDPPQSIGDLAKQAEVVLDEKYSPKSWIRSAAHMRQLGEMSYLQQDYQLSYKHYLRYLDILVQLPKHKEWPRLDASSRAEYTQLKMEMQDVAHRLEEMKVILKQRYADYMAEKAARMSPAQPPTKSAPTLNEISTRITNLSVTMPPSRSVSPVPSSPQVATVSSVLPQPLQTPELISPKRVYQYFTYATPPKILVIDLRPRLDYQRLHMAGCDQVNIDPSVLDKDDLSAGDIENRLSGFHREHFSQRHLYDLVVYMDKDSTQPGQTPQSSRLRQAIYVYEVTKILKRVPALLQGGMDAWIVTVKSSAVRIPGGIGFGDTDGVVAHSYGNLVNPGMSVPLPSAPMEFPFPVPSEERYPPSSPETFDNKFHNFATASQRPEDIQINAQQMVAANYYPSLPTAPFNNQPGYNPPPAQPFTVPVQPVIPTQIPSVLQKPLVMPSPLPARAQPIVMRRAPSPPPGGSSAHAQLTIHTSSMSDMQGSWSLTSNGRGLVGLKNLGNTCYMNSTLQCLFATKPISAIFYDGTFRKFLNSENPLSSKGQIAGAFSQLVLHAFREENGVSISPSRFKEVISHYASQFRGSDQQDSQEFLAFLLDGLHEDLNQGIQIKGGSGLLLKSLPEWAKPIKGKEDDDDPSTPDMIAAEKAWLRYLSRNDSIIVSLFQGQLQSQLKCATCGKTSTTFNPFMYLSLPIPKGHSIRLADCLNEFIREETLDEGDSWKCPQCKVPRKATKRLSISRLPKILLVHLKRFSFHGPFRDKLDQFIDFPIRGMDLFPHLSSSLRQQLVSYYDTQKQNPNTNLRPVQKYDLYAISNHFGGLNGGHYTAVVRQQARKVWLNFDDSRVNELCQVGDTANEEQLVKTKAAYSLFYVSWAAS